MRPAGGRGRGGFPPEYLELMPISAQAKADMRRLQDPAQPDYMPGLSSAEKKARLATMSLEHYLLEVAKVDKQCLWFYMATGRGVFCVGADAIPALFGWEMGVPGFAGLKLEPTPDGVLADLPGGHHGRQKAEGGGGSIHFPDGNATVARLLVRWLIPDAVPGRTQEDVGAAPVDYARLDRDGQTARIRLSSTVVNVRHDGDPGAAREVVVTYNRAGRLADVRARHVVMACWNMVIPHLVPELPATQKEALVYGVKGPLVYTSVALRNWRAFQKLGVANISAPTMYHDSFGLGEAVSLGDLHHPQHAGRADRHPHGPASRARRASRARSSTGSAAPTCSRPRSRPSSATSAISWPARSAAAASIRRATSPPSPSTAGRTATPTPTTA